MMDFDRIAKKLTLFLFLSQSLSSAGFIAAFTVNSIIAVDLTGNAAMAGVPGAFFFFGLGLGAIIWGTGMELIGRRKSLSLGQVIGVIGSAICLAAVFERCFPLFLAGLVLAGIARSAVDLGRFSAAEVHLPDKRGRAISKVVLGSTVGAIFGPLLVGPSGKAASFAGLPELAGPFGLGCVVLLIASIMIFSGLRPEPRDVARELARLHPEAIPVKETRPIGRILRQPGVIAAMLTMIFAQMVMMVPMSITAVHMKANQHPLSAISFVISAHTLGMYAFSILSGNLTDRCGRSMTIILGSVIMIVSCIIAAPATTLLPLTIALFLLGLGWNLAYVAGSTLLSDQLSPPERAKTQGVNDFLLNVSSALSQVGSGMVFALGGYDIMAWTAGALATVPLIVAVRRRILLGRDTKLHPGCGRVR
ncbi:MAG: MFS transporter [Desulfobacteraceae bacterium]|nr:MFS transporter [Desulfobacteraceae bacterium]